MEGVERPKYAHVVGKLSFFVSSEIVLIDGVIEKQEWFGILIKEQTDTIRNVSKETIRNVSKD